MNNPTLMQYQDHLKQIFAQIMGLEPHEVKKEVSDTLSEQKIILRGAKQRENGMLSQGNIIIKQLAKDRFQIAGTIVEDSDTYIIGGKEVKCQVEHLPTALAKIVSESRIKAPKKRSLRKMLRR